VTTKNLRVRATFLVDGSVAGTWTIEAKRRLATLRIAPFATLGKRVRAALAEEGESLVRFAEPQAAAHAVTFDE
jgi:hypothetical protein